jgi:hypothetical protein
MSKLHPHLEEVPLASSLSFRSPLALAVMVALASLTPPHVSAQGMPTMQHAAAAPLDPAWRDTLKTIFGRPGAELAGDVYRVGLPRTDLKVSVDGVELRPGFALGSWVAFQPQKSGELMVMGDIVLTDKELAPVMRKLAAGGIDITAIHNHLIGSQPTTIYMHISAHGGAAQLGEAIKAALQESGTPLQPSAAGTPIVGVEGVDTAAFARALGYEGRANGGVYGVLVPRADATSMHGEVVPNSFGLGTVINLQAAGGGKAAITGDFELRASEVVPVQRALMANGINVTAIHTHMIDEEPRLIYMHYWAVNDPETLGRGLAAALAQTKSKPAG